MRLIFLLLGCVLAAAGLAADVREWTSPLSPELRRLAGLGSLSRLTTVHALVATPPGFDPARPWPVLLVSATSDPGYNSSRVHARQFLAIAAAAGWVVLAADPPSPLPPQLDTNEIRHALALAAFRDLARDWPGVEKWPLALAGHSGGAKRTGWLGAMFARDGRLPVGLFQSGCNASTADAAINRYGPPRREFRRVPVFLSSGDADRIATVRDHALVEKTLREDGFTRVRREVFAGGHVLHTPHAALALAWFDELRGAGQPAPAHLAGSAGPAGAAAAAGAGSQK